MPRKKSFKYEAIEGKPWPHENFISDLEFSILKPLEQIAKEEKKVEDQKIYFFSLEKEKEIVAKQQLDEDLDKFIAKKSRNKPSFKSQKEHQIELKKLENKVNNVWNNIYKKGVIQNNGNIEGKDANYVIYVNNGDVANSRYLNDFYTLTQATELIKEIDVQNEDDYNDVIDLLIESLTQNVLFNSKDTEINLEAERNKISQVSGKVEIGELIVSKGELVNQSTFLKIKSYKKEFESKQISSRENKFVFIGQILLISLCFLCIFLYIKKNRERLFRDTKSLKFILLNVILFVALTRFSQLFPYSNVIYVVPFCTLPLLIRSFYDLRLALFVHTITIVLIGWLAPDPFHFVFIQLMAGILSVLTIKSLYKRSDLFISVGKITIVYVITFAGIALITEGTLFGQNDIVYGFLVLSAFLTLLTYPLVYIYENLFSLVSDITLLELADTNHPLLKEMSAKAPGTFQHSLQVSNLAEQAVMEIGGNVLLVRVGALYHDIGKIENALFFIENQIAGINPHDELSYDESAKLIISHVIKGIEKAKKHKLPEQVIDFIRTHHGDSMVQYFYRKYINKFPEKINDSSQFQYPGPKPFSKETAVLMMADSVEAASRSLPEKNTENITKLVEKIIQYQMDQKQFDNASVTLREINTIKKIFIKKLLNIYHLRIEYPGS